MPKSMTGYGKNVYTDDTCKIVVEIKSVNSRYLEFINKIPRSLNYFEDSIRKAINDDLQEKIICTLKGAVDNLNIMRENEGSKIAKDLKNRANNLKELTTKLESYTQDIEKTVFEKLQKKITELLSQVGLEADYSKIIEQAAFYADKMNVTEEIVRLYSHIEQLDEFLSQDSVEIGKKIDFLLQEMNREINTVGSKSQKSEIISLVVDIKSEIEKIREQIQNIE